MSDRLKDALEALFQLMLPRLAYAMQWEGRVLLATPASPPNIPVPPAPPIPSVFATPATVNVQLTDPDALAIFGPSFSAIPIPLWADAGGLVTVPTVGSLVRVGFVNGSPQRPYIAGFDPQVMAGIGGLAYGLRLFGVALALDPAAAAAAAVLLTAIGTDG